MNEKDNSEFVRQLDAAIRALLGMGVPPTRGDRQVSVRIVRAEDILDGGDHIEGLTNTLEGVRTQCEYATLEARLQQRKFCDV